LALQVEGRLGMGSNVGSFDLYGGSKLQIGKIGLLSLKARIFNLETPQVYQGIMVNGQNIYNNDHTFTNGISVSGDFNISVTNTKLSFLQSVVNNALVFGSDYKPRLLAGALTQTVGQLEQYLRFRKFHLHSFGVVQSYSSDEIRLPSWYTYHTAYWRARVFRKVLDLKIGADILYIPSYKGMNYFPLLGQFYNQDAITPSLNQSSFYLHGRISTFRFFVRWENVVDYFNSNVDYQIGKYPLLDARMRVGLRWVLLD
jgi:hypothetical protein